MFFMIITELGWYREMKSRPLWGGIFLCFSTLSSMNELQVVLRERMGIIEKS